MRDMTALHPLFQVRINRWIIKCAERGYFIKIGECVRTVKEQDDLYAKGRTAPGTIVTKAKGSTYSSMHQWGIACDFYLDMDIDGDGIKTDDAYNDKLNTFRTVGKIAVECGLEWGGDWTTIIDKPHVQMKEWGSTPAKLKKLYGTPMRFRSSWYPSKLSINAASTKEDIIWLQTQLTKCVKGYTIKVTGVYDQATQIAVLMYWLQLGWNADMDSDGKTAGKSTCNALVQERKE